MKEQEILAKAGFIVKKHGLNMKLIGAKYEDNNTKLIISFSADNRVDFRDLVRELASEFKARIELKQIGARDEAREIGAICQCGMECCCKRFLKEFDNINIKMAKNQNMSLNPNRINGLCGRLLCCLGFEDSNYCNGCLKDDCKNKECKS